MRIAEAVALGRIHAESLMTDSVKVWRASTEPPTEGEWGEVIPAPPLLVYEGKAKGQNDRTYPNSPNVAESARVTLMVAHVHFPHGTTAVRPRRCCGVDRLAKPAPDRAEGSRPCRFG